VASSCAIAMVATALKRGMAACGGKSQFSVLSSQFSVLSSQFSVLIPLGYSAG
jgi:hypothetical protein